MTHRFMDITVKPIAVAALLLSSLAATATEFEHAPLPLLQAGLTLDQVEGLEIVGYDMNFYCLDLTNTAQVRAFRDEVASYVVFCQAEDRDFEEAVSVFEAITRTLLSGANSD